MNALCELVLEIWQTVLWRGTWHGALVVLAALAIERTWSTMPSHWRSWLWRLVFVKLVIVCLPISIVLPILPQSERRVETTRSDKTATAESVGVDLRVTAANAVSPTIVAPRNRYLLVGLASVWLLGVAANVYVGRKNMSRILQQLRQSRVLAHETLRQTLEPLLRRLGVCRPPLVRWTSEPISPCVLSRRGATILLPAEWLQTCTVNQLRLALAHELAHLVRGDLIWNRFVAACRAVFFFHPLVWLASRRHLAAQERACDELALRTTDGSPAEYAQLLLQFVDQPTTPAWCGVVSMTGTVSLLRERIATMDYVSRSKRVSWMTAWAVALLASLSLVPFSLAQQPSAPNSSSKKSPGETTAPTKEKSQGASASASASSSAQGFGTADGNNVSAQAQASASVGDGNDGKKAKPSESKSASSEKNYKKPAADSKKKSSVKQSASSTNHGNGERRSRRTEAADGNRNVMIDESNSQIRVVINDGNGETVVVAKDLDDLKRQNPAAFEMFQKFAGNLPLGDAAAAGAALGQFPLDLNQGPKDAKEMMRKQLKQLRNSDEVRGTPLEGLLDKLEQQVDGLNER